MAVPRRFRRPAGSDRDTGTWAVSSPIATRALEDAIRLYLAINNEDPKPFVWVKTADPILASIERFCLRTSGTGH